MSRNWCSLWILLGVTLAFSRTGCLAADLNLTLVTQSVIDERLRAGLVPEGKRQGAIAQLFQQAGCQPEEQRVSRASNVICTLPGQTDSTIVVGGHFDFVDRGAGIVDDWTGTSLLVSLYETLKNKRLQHTYKFIAFADEERGLFGSAHYVKNLRKEQMTSIAAFVNLECLGLTLPKVWVQRSTPALTQQLLEVANATHIPLSGVDVEKVGDDDTHPFLAQKIPVISIHSITQETWGILHSRRDNLAAVDGNYYYDAYRLVAFYLAYLDVKLP